MATKGAAEAGLATLPSDAVAEAGDVAGQHTLLAASTETVQPAHEADRPQEDMAVSDNSINDLETQIVVSEQEIVTTEIELVDTIENVKPGVGQEFEWETVNLDINQDGVVDENDLQA